MKEYFYKREYKWLYLTKFFYIFANSFIDIFGTVMLYKNGMPLYEILLIYGLRFGLMGLCSPLFLKVASKYGIASCAILANMLRIAGVYMIQNGAQNNLLIFVFVMSLPGALSNPIADAVSSKYVENEHRGRYNSMRNIARICGQAFASIFVTWGVVTNNQTLLLLIISIFFLLDYLCTAVVDYKPKIENRHVFQETIKYVFKHIDSYELIFCLRTSHIIERLFVPLYLYLVLQDFVAFGTVVTISLMFQMITVVLVGRLTDKDTQKTNNIVTLIKVMITAVFLFVRDKIWISFNKMLSDNFEKVYETTVQTSLQNKIKLAKEDNSLLSTVGQMSLCFTEFFVFSGLSIMSYFVGSNVFYVIFILSIFSSLGINVLVKK